ncbi:MAG TPA: ribonuclease III [Nitrospira sp.]|nr:ribonuclease III [Nitrospira sp.]
MMSAPSVDALQSSLAYWFQNVALIEEALTHKSYVNEQKTAAGPHNERLEFLGDAALSLIVSERLASMLPEASEGALSKFKARLVSETVLAEVGRRVRLGSCLRLGRGEELSNGRDKDSLLADALEAVLAAVYLDGGLDAARHVVVRLFAEELAQVATQQHRPGADDYKTQFQEWCQRRFDSLPQYVILRESGPDHDKVFEVEVSIEGESVGRGVGRSKKEAEQLAAKQALQQASA